MFTHQLAVCLDPQKPRSLLADNQAVNMSDGKDTEQENERKR